MLLGAPGTDLFGQFVGQRQFAFGELRSGNLPLWNPHIFSGMPALGNIQFALLYPGNLLYLALPLGAATNATTMLHLALSGILMGFWVSSLGNGLLTSALAGLLYLGCGAHFPHLYAGHLTMLCVLSWAPLLFWSIDGVVQQGKTSCALVGSTALGLMLLGGYPQLVFHFGVTAFLYALFRLRTTSHRLRKTLLVASIPVLAICMASYQLAATAQLQTAAVRGGRLPFDYAAMFSFPPENLITLLTPFPLGGSDTYWGRAYLWEMELFLGLTALVMAGLALAPRGAPDRWFLAGLVFFLLLLALGKNTPLFAFLYDHAPGFDRFRGHSKWILPASLLLILLASQGFQRFLRYPSEIPRLPGILLLLAAGLGVVSMACIHGATTTSAPAEWWQALLGTLAHSGESYAPPTLLSDPAFLAPSLMDLGKDLGIAAGTLVFLALLVWLARRKTKLALGVIALAVLEILLFDRAYVATFPIETTQMRKITAALAAEPGNYRVGVPELANSAMSTGALDFWGYDPFVPRRYAQFVAFTQGVDLDTPAVDIPIHRWDPLLGLVRLRYVFYHGENGELHAGGPYPHLPRALLVPQYRLVEGHPAVILAALSTPAFDPTREVLLEEVPPLGPTTGTSGGLVTVRDISTDEILIDAQVDGPCYLVLTDPYFPGWRAEGLANSVQEEYILMQANFILQAIPLQQGQHRIRLVFNPPGLTVWGIVSLATIAAMTAFGAFKLVARLHRGLSGNGSTA